MAAYTEPVKNQARQLVIKNAIVALTGNRTTSTLVRRSYVSEVKARLLRSDLALDRAQAARLNNSAIKRWESFYDSIVQVRRPANLKIAYLAGPNPENDLRVFCQAGVLPENIWAFESKNATYSTAVMAALNSEFRFIKIVNGGIDAFLEASLQRFDIIYLDFSGPLPSRNKKQKTLAVLTRVLARHAVNSPGALITNFSLPTEKQDSIGRALLAKLVACYLYPKDFLEGKKNTTPEGPVANGLDPEKWHEVVRADLDKYYGQFITRLLMDHSSFISQYDRFPTNNPLFGKFFNAKDRPSLTRIVDRFFHFNDDEESDRADDHGGGDVIVESGQYPFLWTLAALDKTLNGRDTNYPQFVFEDDEFSRFADLFLSQLDIIGNKADLLENVSMLSYLLSEGQSQKAFFSSPIKEIHDKHSFRKFYQFCDLFLFHQALELLFRQVANPYHVNVEKTARWRYQAKDTPMFMDLLVLDECRYLYDWMPTADMFSKGIFDIERQLIFRFVLDAVGKHRRWYNPEYFSGTAVIDQHMHGFEAKILRPRKLLRSNP
jgi:hypothetical protein